MKKTTLITCLAAAMAVVVSKSAATDTAATSTGEEIAFRAELRQLYDKNGDGAIDARERRVIERDLQRGKIPVPSSLRTRDEVKAFRAKVVAAYDADGNGALDQWEFLSLQWDVIEGGDAPARNRAVVVADHRGN